VNFASGEVFFFGADTFFKRMPEEKTKFFQISRKDGRRTEKTHPKPLAR
jgi:hypothetical protein